MSCFLFADKNVLPSSVPAPLPSPPPVLLQARSLDPHAAPSPAFTFPLLSSPTSPFSPSFSFSPSPHLSPEASGCEQDAFLAAALRTKRKEEIKKGQPLVSFDLMYCDSWLLAARWSVLCADQCTISYREKWPEGEESQNIWLAWRHSWGVVFHEETFPGSSSPHFTGFLRLKILHCQISVSTQSK